MKRLDAWLGGAASLALLYASWVGWAPFGWAPPSLTEALGFVTGALCVYLTVLENVWNFPVGIANSVFFLVLFVEARLYGDASPFLDALTTILSLGAQYLLNRKAVENWLLWMAADVVQIYLYFYKELHLTAVLYFVFLGLCVAGLRGWLKTMSEQRRAGV